VDLATHRFVHLGRVEIVGKVPGNQKLRQGLLLEWFSGGLIARLIYTTNGGAEIRQPIPIFSIFFVRLATMAAC
jgi:hypothetical protein